MRGVPVGSGGAEPSVGEAFMPLIGIPVGPRVMTALTTINKGPDSIK